ncbi:protein MICRORCHIDIA 6-like [Rhododendron vialii]|uniref:protein MICRORCHIDIA 6-like n=1 Tax=Rhododendron vialii TaxID=182163 RepID=UPI00265F81EE|nr:protein MICRORCHIDIA 6-like [Rhododendron vialii]
MLDPGKGQREGGKNETLWWNSRMEKFTRYQGLIQATHQKGVKQAPHSNENPLQELEFTSLMQENKKLRSKLLELERGVEDLNLKVQQLWSELGDLESEYARMLAELGAIHD